MITITRIIIYKAVFYVNRKTHVLNIFPLF